jgi:DNA-binding response OmpR family regulator
VEDEEREETRMTTGVLVATGEAAMAAALALLLTRAGHRVQRIDTVDAVHDALACGAGNVLVIDQDGPSSADGLAFLETVRMALRDHAPPALLLLGRCRNVDRAKAEALGAGAVLAKPFRGDDLVASVRRLAAVPAVRGAAP